MDGKPDIIVIGASIGGLVALRRLFARLPAGLPAAILAVMHIGSRESLLPELLAPHSALPVRHARDGDAIAPGTVLIAPPDRHLLVEAGHVCLSHGPKENFARPAVDPLFRSAAIAYRRQAIGVILTGNLDDGTVGLQAIKAYGGTAIVQDPQEAEAPSMPASAIEHVDVDFCLTLDDIAATLVRLVDTALPAQPVSGFAGSAPLENRFLTQDTGMDELDTIGTHSSLTCPECHGSLWEITGADPLRYRCHTGHAYTARTLAAAQEQMAEEALWAAVRALHEKRSLLKRCARQASDSQRAEAAAEHEAAAEQASRHAEILRKLMGAG